MSASMVTICQGPLLKCYPPVELSHSRTISGKLYVLVKVQIISVECSAIRTYPSPAPKA